MNQQAEAFLARLRDYLESNTGSLGRLSFWIEKYTTLANRPFSFKHHEYQREICDDSAYSMVVIKPSQVGLSELTARMTLAFLATNPGIKAIYGLQTVKFASNFFKSRIDPVIRESEALKTLLLPASDSAQFKEFNNGSQLHGVGFSQGVAIISIPASMVVSDETDFADPQSIATAESRLSHAPFVDPETGVRGIRRYFSTPTVDSWGVSGLFAKSNQRRRLVTCKHCHNWFWPNLLEHCVIDGWDRQMTEITAVDVQSLDDRGLLASARLLCPACHQPITKRNLMPDYREWVAERPESRRMSGWQVSPFDLPEFHTPESLLRKLVEFGDASVNHWYNFALGLPFTNALNSVIEGRIEENTVVRPIAPEQAAAGAISGCVAGLDVGKVSWITIGKVVENRLHIVWMEQIRLRSDDGSDLESRVLELLKAYRAVLCVSDAFPYSDTILRLVERYPGFKAAEYSIRDKTLPMVVGDEENDIVKMNRTKTLSYLVKRINSGQVKFPTSPEMPVMSAHIRAIKQIERTKDNGEVVQEWVNTGPDHYAHSLNYLNTAATLLGTLFTSSFAAPVTLKSAQIGSKYRPVALA